MSLHWLEVFKYLYQCHCLGWGYLNQKWSNPIQCDTHTHRQTHTHTDTAFYSLGYLFLLDKMMLSRQYVNHICFSAQSYSIKYLLDGKKWNTSVILEKCRPSRKVLIEHPFSVLSDIWGCILWWVLLINITRASPGRTVRTEAHPGQHSNVHSNTKYLPGGHQNRCRVVILHM